MKWFLLLLLLLNFSCSHNKSSKGIYLNGIYKNKELKYSIGELSKDWKKLNVNEVNLAFYHLPTNGIIYINGKCKGASDASLYVLRTHLLLGFRNKKFLKSEKTKIVNRTALHSILTAELDGVTRKINYFIFKKDGCLYDLVFISPLEHFQKVNIDFLEFIKNLKIIKGSNIKIFIEE